MSGSAQTRSERFNHWLNVVGRLADGVIVGSAIVRLVEQHGGSAELLTRVGDFIAGLKAPLRGGG